MSAKNIVVAASVSVDDITKLDSHVRGRLTRTGIVSLLIKQFANLSKPARNVIISDAIIEIGLSAAKMGRGRPVGRRNRTKTDK